MKEGRSARQLVPARGRPRGLSILLAPFGTEGDVRPLVWLAEGLAARGHRIAFHVTPHYRHLVDARAWPVIEQGKANAFAQAMADPRMWKPMTGSLRLLRLMVDSLPASAAALDACGQAFDLVIGTTAAAGALTWAESRGVPRLMIHLQPMALRSATDPPVLFEGGEWLTRASPRVLRALFRLNDDILSRPFLRGLNAHRRKVGLRPLRSSEELLRGADAIAALFPAWFAAPQSDWPAPLRQFAFPLDRDEFHGTLPPRLRAFLDAGESPIVWAHASMNDDIARFAKAARAATHRLRARMVLVGPGAERLAPDHDFLPLRYAPYAPLFARCRAAVHHGGIGTAARALAAGIPQLVAPRSHDQPDNALRLTRLGVADAIRHRQLDGARAAARLRALLDSTVVHRSCARWKVRLTQEDPRPAVCEYAEAVAHDLARQ